jgi:2-haloacid dehalogenase
MYDAKMQSPAEAVIFDIGGVLLDWDPRHLYRKLFDDEQEMEHFLSRICTPAWHAPHDSGVSTEESCSDLATLHPEMADLIWAWSLRGDEMVAGTIDSTVEILRALHEDGVRCYALTNMEAENFPRRAASFEFFGWFDGAVVSGFEGIAKPSPEIFLRLLTKFDLSAASTLFVDDNLDNVETATALGMQAHLYRSPGELEQFLSDRIC